MHSLSSLKDVVQMPGRPRKPGQASMPGFAVPSGRLAELVHIFAKIKKI